MISDGIELPTLGFSAKHVDVWGVSLRLNAMNEKARR